MTGGGGRGLQAVGFLEVLGELEDLEDLHVDQRVAQALDVIGERSRGFRGGHRRIDPFVRVRETGIVVNRWMIQVAAGPDPPMRTGPAWSVRIRRVRPPGAAQPGASAGGGSPGASRRRRGSPASAPASPGPGASR